MLTIDSVDARDTTQRQPQTRVLTLLELVGANLEEPFKESLLVLFGYAEAFVRDRHREIETVMLSSPSSGPATASTFTRKAPNLMALLRMLLIACSTQ